MLYLFAKGPSPSHSSPLRGRGGPLRGEVLKRNNKKHSSKRIDAFLCFFLLSFSLGVSISPLPLTPEGGGVRGRGEVKTTREKHNSSLLFSSIFYYGFPLLTLHLRRAAVRFIQQDIFTCPLRGARYALYTSYAFLYTFKGGTLFKC